jgi:glyoxylase-like metal-dependent hydrolase (beta-lactamase superfamily II)
MKIICVPTGPLSTNTYVVINDSAEKTAEGKTPCAVIDPANSRKVLALLDERGLACTDILLTHGHFDHIGAAEALMNNEEAEKPRLMIHALDAPMLGNPELNASAGLIGRAVTAPEATDLVQEGDEMELAGLRVKVLHTPGHTPGSVCYEIEGELFTGDTLFEYGWGRTDLPGGDEGQMEASLRRLMPIVRTMKFHAGH